MNTIIIGMGKSGIAAMHALTKEGHRITIQDSKTIDNISEEILNFAKVNNISTSFGEMPGDFSEYDMMVLSPGVDPEKDFVLKAKEQGVEIVGELELAYRLAKGTFIGITGTNGKTTTTTLVGEIFKNAKRKTNVVGNIGLPVITVSSQSTEEDWMVTEVSSFQLQTASRFKPMVSAIINLTPDHLNRHHTMENYGATKAKIWENQDENGYFVVNLDDPVCMSLCYKEISPEPKAVIVPFSRKQELDFGAFLMGEQLVIKNEAGEIIPLIDRNELRIIGDHNVENVLAASAICYFSGISPAVITDTLKNFGGVEHRIEFVRELDGVKYYNDSKGTNVDSVVIALRAIKKSIILIAGGDAKSQVFDDLIDEFDGRVKHLLLFGRDANMIQEACDRKGFTNYSFQANLKECVLKAHMMAEKGDTVLLSPACASWDMYPNFEVRGEDFKNLVRGL